MCEFSCKFSQSLVLDQCAQIYILNIKSYYIEFILFFITFKLAHVQIFK